MPIYNINNSIVNASSFKKAVEFYNNNYTHVFGPLVLTPIEQNQINIDTQNEILGQIAQPPIPPPPANWDNVNWQNFANIHQGGVVFIDEAQNIKPAKKESELKEKDPTKITISDIYKYKNLSKYQGLKGKIPLRADTTFIGVEIELEKVDCKYLPQGTWQSVEDGSLKEEGREFVTIPIQFKYLEVELERLFKGLRSCGTSSRCSVHVHMNVRDFTLEELKKFIILYIIFEKSLYNCSGKRINNNFCVPLIYYMNLVKEFIFRLDKGHIFEHWFKYFGLNLSPIFGGESKPIGTVEFRHMHGTTDIPFIINWINLIVSLKITAKDMSWKELENHIKTMNTTSGYYWLTNHVFKDFADQIVKQPTFKEDVEHCITAIKSILVSNESEKHKEIIPIIKKR